MISGWTHLDLRLWGERERDLRLSRDRDLSRSLRLLSRSREVERERRLSATTNHYYNKSLEQNQYVTLEHKTSH